MYQKLVARESSNLLDRENEEMDISKILKDIEYLGKIYNFHRVKVNISIDFDSSYT